LSFAVEVGVALKTNLTEHLAKLRAASDRVDRLCAKAVEEAEEVQAMLRRRVALERQLADARQQLADWTREARGRPHPSVDAMQKRIRGIDDALARSSDDLAGRVRRSLDTRKALEEAGSALDDISRGGRGRIARMATKALASRTAKIAAKALAKLIPVLNIVSLAMDLVELIELATLLARIVKQSSDAAGEDGEGGEDESGAEPPPAPPPIPVRGDPPVGTERPPEDDVVDEEVALHEAARAAFDAVAAHHPELRLPPSDRERLNRVVPPDMPPPVIERLVRRLKRPAAATITADEEKTTRAAMRRRVRHPRRATSSGCRSIPMSPGGGSRSASPEGSR
jgi:hypothetical protein